jgi:hypothetical protein
MDTAAVAKASKDADVEEEEHTRHTASSSTSLLRLSSPALLLPAEA